ncbi:hypothetical protein [Rathayibacter sp. AY1A7]|uniref:hypothetical protein n=1 Tax=Rathayibacter sp. AY1A7 TaxID=2080524 RepID=UPI0011B07C77|nr:hypothetical protein [Rathayibacter sp. AY1A7]
MGEVVIEHCDVVYSWKLPGGLPDCAGLESPGRRLVVSPQALRVEHWAAHDSPGALHVFIEGARVRADGTHGGTKGFGFSDEPDLWGELVRDTDDLPDWSRPYLEAARAWETARGNVRPPRLRLI